MCIASIEAEVDAIIVHCININGGKRSVTYGIIVIGVACNSTSCCIVNKRNNVLIIVQYSRFCTCNKVAINYEIVNGDIFTFSLEHADCSQCFIVQV